jgi:hypothetical protein
MVAGGLIQLVTTTGNQDAYLSYEPEISFFKTVYRRHTNFSIETVEEIFYNNANFGKIARCRLPKIGDLISNMSLYIELPSLNQQYDNLINKSIGKKHIENIEEEFNQYDEYNNRVNNCVCTDCLKSRYKQEVIYGWTNAIGHALIDCVQIEIGGKVIDRQYGEWLEIWTELTQPLDKRAGYFEMVGKVDATAFKATTNSSSMQLYVPLNFWFCRNIGLALPIMALQYHNVELAVRFREFNQCWVTNKKDAKWPKPEPLNASVLIDYVYLDVEERRQFYEETHTYLFEQVQFNGECEFPAGTNQANVDMYFNHPVKELVWVMQRKDVVGHPDGVYRGSNYPKGNDWFNYSIVGDRKCGIVKDFFDTATVQLNGWDRFDRRKAKYFRLLHPYYFHTRVPTNYIYNYSFALKPEDHQPTGSMNFSRVDNTRLNIVLGDHKLLDVDYKVRVYATNYNVLIITHGMGGKLFEN